MADANDIKTNERQKTTIKHNNDPERMRMRIHHQSKDEKNADAMEPYIYMHVLNTYKRMLHTSITSLNYIYLLRISIAPI